MHGHPLYSDTVYGPREVNFRQNRTLLKIEHNLKSPIDNVYNLHYSLSIVVDYSEWVCGVGSGLIDKPYAHISTGRVQCSFCRQLKHFSCAKELLLIRHTLI